MKINSVVKSIVSPQPTGVNPSELSISESMKAQENALSQGSENLQDGVNLAQTADGALDSVTDNLQRIRELTIQAQNSILTDDDKSFIQDEISELLNDVQDNLKNTEFNTINVFDGGFGGNIQSGGTNQGRVMQVQNTSLGTLGLNGFDISSGGSVEDIDNAINQVNETRSQIGSQTNVFESAIRSNDIARENTLSSRSKFDDDFSKQVSELSRLQIIQQYKFLLQTKEQESQAGKLSLFI